MGHESRLRFRAPAKLNLYLRVVGKRADGFHELETIFERIDLADELTFEAAATLSLTCTDPTLSCGDDNLVLKAARLLQQKSGAGQGARIHLTKRIPIAAGLGGGSSDAATTLRGLNTLWNLLWPKERLIELGAQLGSDVPFFLYDTPFAIGRGRGEICEPIPGQPLAQVLVVPDAQLSTKEIYEELNLPLTPPTASITIVAHALRNGPASAGLAAGLWNDLEPVAIRRCPVIPHIQETLRACGVLAARLSGSGPAVFGLCRDRAHAHEMVTTLRTSTPSSWRIELVQTDR
ncbi:MAG: 4-(cytidine 5'-diphospho)-2-C-methyl-D-erythritol kinase [Candidatus Omnitrophica bacterium]|nr:4-(cytidine 5'-diphospho)-2-C-methyl-D-erythritol kinase [Candidatus Omnitrophota bacterium]